MHKRFFLALSLLALFSVSPASIRAWEPVGESILPVRIPAYSWQLVQPEQTDFDNDGVLESMEIIGGQARIVTGDILRWQSPPEWVVKQAALSDLNQDGAVEVVLLVWRPFKSWPVDRWLPSGGRIDDFQNAKGESCHIILIGWHRGNFAERWAGSALAQPISTFEIADINQDGFDELITLESTYETPTIFPANALSVWEWNGFGFSLVSKLEGNFTEFFVVQNTDNQFLLLTP
jgi:hypothetical protein